MAKVIVKGAEPRTGKAKSTGKPWKSIYFEARVEGDDAEYEGNIWPKKENGITNPAKVVFEDAE